MINAIRYDEELDLETFAISTKSTKNYNLKNHNARAFSL
jgi:hypothetical protein